MRRPRSIQIRIGLIGGILLTSIVVLPQAGVSATGSAAIRAGALHDVVAIGASDVWVVGSRGTVSHWDGSTWQTQRLGNLRVPDLTAIDAVSSGDAWAVGGVVALDAFRPYLTHWNGAKWIRTRAPSVPGEAKLTDVVATSPSNAWAVGWLLKQSIGGQRVGGVVFRWNGSRWRRIPAPRGASLSGVAVVDGAPIVSGQRGATSTPVIARRRGGAWRVVPMPEPPGRSCTLNGITATPTAAAGSCTSPGRPRAPYLVQRHDGAWDMVPTTGTGALSDVAGGPAAWAVGGARPANQLLALRLSRTGAWNRAATPHLSGGGTLQAVDVRAFGDAWAVGWRGGAGRFALVLRWDGAGWVVSTPP